MNITHASTCAGVACDMHGRCQRYARVEGSAEPIAIMGFPPREGCEHFVPVADEFPKEKLLELTDESLSAFLAKLASTAVRQGTTAEGTQAFGVTLTERGLTMLLAASSRLLPAATPRQPLTIEQIAELREHYSNEFGLEGKYADDFARAVERACAEQWGVKLEGGAA